MNKQQRKCPYCHEQADYYAEPITGGFNDIGCGLVHTTSGWYMCGWEIDLKPGQKPLSAYYWHIGEPEPTFHEYKHVDGILKHVKTTYKELPF